MNHLPYSRSKKYWQIIVLVAMILFTLSPVNTRLVAAAPPDNDLWEDAIEITLPFSLATPLNTTEANIDPDEPDTVSCDGELLRGGKATVWYKYIATATELISLDTLGSTTDELIPGSNPPATYQYDTYIAVWTGDIANNPSLIACNDDNEAGLVSQLGFNAINGVTYYIQIAQYFGLAGTNVDPGYNGGNLNFHAGFGAQVDVTIGADLKGSYVVLPSQDERDAYPDSGGPLKVQSTNGVDLISAVRLQAMSGGILRDYNESIGTPANALSHKYYFPVYENLWAPLNSQIRFAHLSPSAKQIKVTIGTEIVFNESVPANTEKRLTFAKSGGPVIIESVDGVTKVLAAIRLQCMNSGILHCYSESPGIPVEALSAKYYFPVYENLWAPLNSQLRFAHLSPSTQQIKVTIAGEVVFNENVPANTEKRLTFAKSGGPVIVESVDGVTQVIAAIRLQAMSGGILRDYNESMGIPESTLSHKYFFPTYENKWAPLNSQIRFAHLSPSTKQIKVTIGGEVVFNENVPANTEKRLTFNKSGGPVIIESVDGVTEVIAAIRLQCMNTGILHCYSETPALPVEALDTIYYFPVYENLWVHLNSQVRFSVP